jgi:hypothetical protein
VGKYYIEPRRQLEQLEAAGFRDVRMYGPDASEHAATGGRVNRWWWLYYLCAKLVK